MTGPKTGPAGPVDLKTVNFDQSVITEDGRPGSPLRVVYHGTHATFSEFRVSERGSMGRGIYFASTFNQAFLYGGEDPEARIMQTHLCLQRPYFYQIREPQVVDIWGEGLVVDIFDAKASTALLNKTLMGDEMFGNEISTRLQAMGYDGIVATYADGSQELVVFEPSQTRMAAPTQTAQQVYSMLQRGLTVEAGTSLRQQTGKTMSNTTMSNTTMSNTCDAANQTIILEGSCFVHELASSELSAPQICALNESLNGTLPDGVVKVMGVSASADAEDYDVNDEDGAQGVFVSIELLVTSALASTAESNLLAANLIGLLDELTLTLNEKLSVSWEDWSCVDSTSQSEQDGKPHDALSITPQP